MHDPTAETGGMLLVARPPFGGSANTIGYPSKGDPPGSPLPKPNQTTLFTT